MVKNGLYRELGVEPHATTQEINDAFESRVRGLDAGSAEYEKLRQAREVLSDVELRARYDVCGKVKRRKRTRSSKERGTLLFKVRTILNILFLCGAAAAAVLFILSNTNKTMGTGSFYAVCTASLSIKVLEYILRVF